MIAEELLMRIKDVWESERARVNHPIKESPSIAELRAMVQTAFFASLKREEGNPISFRLALITEQEIDDVSTGYDDHQLQIKMRFSAPLPLNVETISKLAQAFDRNFTALAVEQSSEDATIYHIWGAIYFDNSKHDGFDFNSIQMSGPGYHTEVPDCFMVKATSIGSLTISLGRHNMGYFENGEFTQSAPSPFAQKAIQPYIKRVFEENRGFEDRYYWAHYDGCLKKILFEAADRGGGGTIVFVPSSRVEEIIPRLDAGYSFPGGLGVNHLLNESIKAVEERQSYFLQVKEILGRRLTALSQLSGIDGALVITSDWEIVRFGAKLRPPEKWNGNIFLGRGALKGAVEEESVPFDRSKLGTRHNSAIDFVGAFPDVVAFVISEDGPIRGFVRRDEETILCWRDLRVAIVA
jgi:hypothetical protein